jgi:hypothetical protein
MDKSGERKKERMRKRKGYRGSETPEVFLQAAMKIYASSQVTPS